MLGESTKRHVESEVGRLPLFGRYHQAGRVLEDDYELTKEVLGSGASGNVLLAYSRTQARRKVAVKSACLADIPLSEIQDLKVELRALLCTDHPHVVRLLDVYVSDEKVDLVMECMNGGELRTCLGKRGLREEQAAGLVRQMLLALNYLHSNGLVHRDLKLSNFMFTADRRSLKLIDFGLSKFCSQRQDSKVDCKRRTSRMHTCCGTLGYIAPEVIEGDYTSQCDMWSLGVIVYILLSGEMPFAHEDEKFLVELIRCGEYAMKPSVWLGLSMEAMNFTQMLLRKDASQRPEAIEALEHPWLKEASLGPPTPDVSPSVAKALTSFGDQTPLRRCCMRMMAMGLADEDIANLRDIFLRMDKKHEGRIELLELADLLAGPLNHSEDTLQALDFSGDNSLHFSEFLAANLGKQDLPEELIQTAFRRFDRQARGKISLDDLKQVGGRSIYGEHTGELLAWLEAKADRYISYTQFAAYLSGSQFIVPRESCCNGHKCHCVVQ
eukprot:CAMPEP_0197655778 /NCGR_PEP_ID=MMETSP1338-20131121/39662_1 /TAXON_ID=43686 ORGANISM="Pelagodinium beii, Strain RCC1491" /NCGR_SAMPLE_ID=MMETSP1338 /ASSEMBLY_ACC=CAM_ASM_000754 /LENGTH=495 /DNA_ID=CAMNT_0043231493 /DNA_START=63 /DNA_END=1550 /DNA_ORIENTATION=+